MSIHFEPFDDRHKANPYPHYRALQQHAPVHHAPEADAYVISRYADVRHVLRRPDLFSSDAMRTMLIGARPGSNPLEDPAVMPRILALLEHVPFEPQDMMVGRNLIAADPPQHDVMRQMVNRGFTPRRIRALESRARGLVEECMARARAGEPFDLIHDLAVPLPVTLIAEMLGVERERLREFKHWSDELIAGATGSGRTRDPGDTRFPRAMGDLSRYLLEIIERRRRQPSDDLIGTLLAARDGEEALSDQEIVFFGVLLLVAGNETTTNLLGNAVNALLDHPEQLERVRGDRSLLPGLVEETLRYDGPIQLLMRRATGDLEIAGTRIPKDAGVILLLGAANRDPEAFPDPDRFDVGRDTAGHLGFGFGVHFCLGASLARLEARVALDALLDVLPDLVRTDNEVDYVDSFIVRGPRRLSLARAA